MDSPQLQQARAAVRQLYARWRPGTGIAQIRGDWDAFFAATRLPAQVEAADAGGVPCFWVEAPGATRTRVLLFLHGGGYQIGSHVSHHNLVAALSARSGCAVLAVDYRLAPEHRCPAALDDALAAWRWLRAQGQAARRIALCGDSAGAALAVLLMVRLRDADEALPAAAALMSPWVDLQVRGASAERNAASDGITDRATLLRMARSYLGREGRPDAPEVSALHAPLAGLPPLLLQVSRAEVLLDDAHALLARAQAAGVAARLRESDGLPHVFQLFAGRLDAADAAIAEAAHHLVRELDRADTGNHHATST